MPIILLCFIITASITYIIGYLDFFHQLVARILTWLFNKPISPASIMLPKIFECSLCCSFWITIIILLIFSPKYWFVSLLCAFSTKYILYLIALIFTKKTVIYKYAGKLFADCSGKQSCCHRGIDSA